MELVRIELQPLADCAFYGIGLKASFRSTRGLEILVRVEGWIRSSEGKYLGKMNNWSQDPTGKFPLSARDQHQPEMGYFDQDMNFIVPLAREAIQYIEQERAKEKKKDVRLKVTIQTLTLWSRAITSHMITDNQFRPNTIGAATKVSPNLSDANIVLHKWDRDVRPMQNDMWLVSGDGTREFMEASVDKHEREVVIAASDWAQDYAPALGIGRSLHVEMPMPDDLNLPDEVKSKFKVALENLQKMLQDYKRGDWTDLIEDSRGIYELLKDESLVRELLISDGYPSEAIDDICRCLKSLWDFTSKFHHRLDKKKEVIPQLKPSKEEAELIYALSLTLVNLLAKKATRETR